MSTATQSLSELQKEHAAAKERLKDLRFMQKSGDATDEQVTEAKREADRLAAAVRRVAKSGSGTNGKGNTQAVKRQAEKAQTAAKSAAKNGGEKAAVKEPVPGNKTLRKLKDATSLTRVEKGNFHRVTRKNRGLGLHISIYDLNERPSDDTRLRGVKPENGRWVVIAEETGEFIQSPTWGGCGPLITDPTTWLSKETVQSARAEKAAA